MLCGRSEELEVRKARAPRDHRRSAAETAETIETTPIPAVGPPRSAIGRRSA